ncbi:hypothetical protein D3C84_1008250 [compost metagenome]
MRPQTLRLSQRRRASLRIVADQYTLLLLLFFSVQKLQHPRRLDREASSRRRAAELRQQIVIASAAHDREPEISRIAFERHPCIIGEIADHRQIDQHMIAYAVSLQHIPNFAQMADR